MVVGSGESTERRLPPVPPVGGLGGGGRAAADTASISSNIGSVAGPAPSPAAAIANEPSTAALMGVYEEAKLQHFGMHWQQQERYAGPAHDPSRDLSPNLPLHSCDGASSAAGDTTPSPAALAASCVSSSSSSSSSCTSSSSTSSASSASSAGGGGSACSTPAPTVPANTRFPPPPPPVLNSLPLLRPKLEPVSSPPPQAPASRSQPATGDSREVVCGGCGGRITDRFYLLAVDRRWHAACLKCCECKLPLDSELTCFARDGKIYCKDDYYRMFGMKRCGRCQAAILSSELVMRARDLVFHVHCFCCAVCGSALTKGDHFGLRDGAVLCRLHFELAAAAGAATSPEPAHLRLPPPPPPHLHHHHPLPAAPPPPPGAGPPPPGAYPPFAGSPHHPHLAPPPPPPPPHHLAPGEYHHLAHAPPMPPGAPGGPACVGAAASTDAPKVPYFNGAPGPGAVTRQKGRPRKRKPKDLESMTASLDLNADYLDIPFRGAPGTPGSMPGSNGQQRTKRMRTSFKHHQLRTMKSYFAINHNPDAKDLKQLSQKTGLPKRVLQVWFQNARAKWRRMVLKQEGKGGVADKCPDGGGGGGAGALGDLDVYPSPHGPPPPGDYHHAHGQPLQPHSPSFILGAGSPPSLECS